MNRSPVRFIGLILTLVLPLMTASGALMAEGPAASDGAALALTARDVVAGYRQNYLRFKTLFVTWKSSRRHGKNFFNGGAHALTEFERQLEQPGLKADGRAEIARKIADSKSVLEGPSARDTRVFHQQFWTDRRGFQFRYPDTQGEGLGSEESVSFPTVALDDQTANNQFKAIRVTNFGGSRESGFQIWGGTQGKRRMGLLATRLTEAPDTQFPPLAVLDLTLGLHFHPIDVFFGPGASGLEVVGFKKFAGRDVVLVERKTEIPSSGFLLPQDRAKYGNRLRRFDVVSAWIDPARGFLPIRMEWAQRFELDGRRLDSPWGPDRVLDEVVIASVPDGGFYPTHSRERQLEMDLSDPRSATYSIVNAIEGQKAPKTLPREENVFDATDVRANLNMTGLFDFKFPSGTIFLDEQTGVTAVAAPEGATRVSKDMAEERRAEPRGGGAPRRYWYFVVTGVLIALIGGGLLRRHFSKQL